MRRRLSARERGRTWGAICAVAAPLSVITGLLLLLLPAVRDAPLHAQSTPVDMSGLGTGPHAHMSMLLERTIFQVDVVRLDVRLGSDAAARLERLFADGGDGPRGEEDAPDGASVEDAVAAIALDAHDVLATLDFQRDVDLEQFLDGIRENLQRARAAGIIMPESYRTISADLPGWYDFLDGRGIRSGDRMFQRVRGDTLHTVYVAEDGETLLDQVDVGAERRLAVLGGYFAPGSDFREGLVESALRSERAAR